MQTNLTRFLEDFGAKQREPVQVVAPEQSVTRTIIRELLKD